LLSLVAIMGLFQVLTDGTLLKPLNLTNLVLQNSYIVIMALGMLLVIVAGHIDLSVGSVCGFIGALAAVLMVQWGWHPVPTMLACAAAGALIGGAQGWCVAYQRIPSFIVTLAGMLVFKGLTLALLGGMSVGPFPISFQRLSSGFIPEFFADDGELRLTSLLIGVVAAVIWLVLQLRARRRQNQHGMDEEPYPFFLGKTIAFAAAMVAFAVLLSSYKGLPNVLIVMVVLMLVYDFATRRTTVGRRIYALGGNEKAARLSGVKTERLTMYAFIKRRSGWRS
jgi:putative multiple sugar transport system permease protein